MRSLRFLRLAVALIVICAAAAALAAPQAAVESDQEDHEDEQDARPSSGSRPRYYPSQGDPPGGCGQTPGYDEWDSEMLRGGEGESRITGGSYQHWGQFPSFVSLISFDELVWCGGTLISPRHVLTAAHCLQGDSLLLGWRALLGPFQPHQRHIPGHQWAYDHAIDLAETRPCISPGYQFSGISTPDWAVVELAHEATYNAQVQPACLPSGNSPRERRNTRACWLVGTGIASFTQNGNNNNNTEGLVGQVPLLVKRLRVQEDDCPQDIRDKLHHTRLCYGNADPKLPGQVCSGDSGGPVLCRDEAPQRWTVAAIINDGYANTACDFYNHYKKPAIFTDVWRILDQMRQACSWMDLP